MKPKLWDGPNPVGEARARFNETIATPFQTASGPGFTARKMNGFSEVTGAEETTESSVEPLLFSRGYAGPTYKLRGEDVLGESFHAVRTDPHNAAGNGYGFEGDVSSTAVTITLSTGGTISGWEGDAGSQLGLYKRGWIGAVPVVTNSLKTVMGIVTLTYSLTALGRVDKENAGIILFVSPDFTGGVDAFGVPMTQIRYNRIVSSAGGYNEYYLPRPKTDHNYILGPTIVVTPEHFVIMVAEMGHIAGVRPPPGDRVLPYLMSDDPEADLDAQWVSASEQGRLLFYVTTNGGASWSIKPFTGLDEVKVYTNSSGGAFMTESVLGYHFSQHTKGSSDPVVVESVANYPGNYSWQGIRLYDICAYSDFIVMSPTTWVWFTTYSDARYTAGVYTGLVNAVFRTTDGGTTWTKITSPFSPEGSSTSVFVNKGVALSPTIALVRSVAGMRGIDRETKFYRTTDAGVTWAQVTASGLPASVNHKLGYLKVLKAEIVNGVLESSMLGLSCWEDPTTAYVLYTSTDQGTTWDRRGTIAKADYLRRLDYDEVQNASNDIIPNFGILDYRGTIARPVPLDVALPWRHDSLIAPP